MKKNKIVFLDENNKITDEKNATTAIVSEYDENGLLINETFLGYPKISSFENKPIELSQESIDFIKEFNLSSNLDNLDIKKKN